jgi:iron complex transport system substrate-binding protein
METNPLKRLLALALLAACGLLHAEIAVVDDLGLTVRLAQPARRIISLAPHVTESLFAIGAGARIVGTAEYSDYPEAAKHIARIGSYASLDLETIVGLKPDLVIVWESGNVKAHVEKLRAMGFTLYVTEPKRIDDLPGTLERLSQLAGTAEVGRKTVADIRRRLDDLRRHYSRRPPVRTFYQIWKQPLATIGGRQIISSVIDLCGGENVFGQLKTLAPIVSVEAVIAANPEVIIASGMDEARPEWLDDWRRWTSLTAVTRGNLFFIHPDLIQRHTPRLLDGAERLCQQLETARSRRPPG